MKKGIHPNYKEAVIECACGEAIKTRSVKGSYKIDICSKCHPFFTGKQKLIDTAGRVERFERKYQSKDYLERKRKSKIKKKIDKIRAEITKTIKAPPPDLMGEPEFLRRGKTKETEPSFAIEPEQTEVETADETDQV